MGSKAIISAFAVGVLLMASMMPFIGDNGTEGSGDHILGPGGLTVTDIIEVPTTATAGVPLMLTGTVISNGATDQDIFWSVRTTGMTGATIDGSTFVATGPGTATVTATLADEFTDIVVIAAGSVHTVVIKDDGTMWGWGSNWAGQLGDGTTTEKHTPTQTGTDTDWRTVSTGDGHTVAIKVDGTMWSWGWNDGRLGFLGHPDEYVTEPVQVGTDSDWSTVSVGSIHTAALKDDGSLWAWGHNFGGKLGDGTNVSRNEPVQIGTDTDWQYVSAGYNHTTALKDDGSLWAWGYNGYGQLGDGTIVNSYDPVKIGDGWASVSSDMSDHTLAIRTDGSLWAWGHNWYGQVGDGTNGTTEDRNEPVQIGTATDWIYAFTGPYHSMAINGSGELWTWGWNEYGQLGDGTATERNTPVRAGTATDWVSVTGGYYHTVAVNDNGDVWVCGSNESGLLGNGTSFNGSTHVMIGPATDWVYASVGYSHTVAIRKDGTLWAWGTNWSGQIGNGTNASYVRVPTQIGTDTDWSSVSAGNEHTVAVKKDGTLWAWGANHDGQLGDGTNDDRYVPTQIGTDTDWSSVSAGDNHTVAIKKDGTLWAWGYNNDGQLGNGGSGEHASVDTPTLISNLVWTSVSAGGDHTAAIRGDGSLWAWGYNYSGQLGDGTNDDRYIPTRIGTDTNWVSVSAGGEHTAAINANGELWIWGSNWFGQLGDGNSYASAGEDVMENAPIRVGSGTDWISVSAGDKNTFAIKDDGSLWAWGYNSYGQLGDGTYDNSAVPVRIGIMGGWVHISAGSDHTAAIGLSGELWVWGQFSSGQLGGGTADPFKIILPYFTKDFAITVNAAPEPPSITTSSLSNGITGTSYSQTLTASGTTPITWSIVSGTLPEGLTLDGTSGTISGTPTAAGTFSFTVNASNGIQPDAAKALSITIGNASNGGGNGSDEEGGNSFILILIAVAVIAGICVAVYFLFIRGRDR